MKIKCVAPWAGGKRTLAPKIVELLGPHDSYFELFVGGCSILPAKPVADFEIVNDMNQNIGNVLRGLQKHSDWIIDYLKKFAFEKRHYEFAKAMLFKESYGPEAAACQLMVWWMGANGMAGTTSKAWFAQRHSKTGGDPAKRWESFKDSIPALAKRLAGVWVRNYPWQVALELASDKYGTVIYCDPPYLSKKFKYEYDFKDTDHGVLAWQLNKYKHARIVVSYRIANDAERYLLTNLYSPERWKWIEVNVNKNMASASGKAKRNVELLLVNDRTCR